MKQVFKYALWAACGLTLTGCHIDMWIQPKVKSQSSNDLFSDGRGSRDPVSGTVEFGKPQTDDAFYTGREDGRLVRELPVAVTSELIERGQERYGIMCSHCHGDIGDGKGMIAQRGFELAQPVGNYHTERLNEMPVGHFFDVITNGYGTMFPQGSRIDVMDRWAIVAYIRVLQYSQAANVGDLDGETRTKLRSMLDSDAQNSVDWSSSPTVGPLFNPMAPADVQPEMPGTPAFEGGDQ